MYKPTTFAAYSTTMKQETGHGVGRGLEKKRAFATSGAAAFILEERFWLWQYSQGAFRALERPIRTAYGWTTKIILAGKKFAIRWWVGGQGC
jgi:hypothetical protein